MNITEVLWNDTQIIFASEPHLLCFTTLFKLSLTPIVKHLLYPRFIIVSILTRHALFYIILIY